MAIKYSCFISYPHGKGSAYEKFVRGFVEALSDEVYAQTYKEIWIDFNRLGGGYLFNEKIAEDLCRAACMVVIYTPLYFDLEHTYCAREYKAMEILENFRREQLRGRFDSTKGLIIPVVLRGWDAIPAGVKNTRHAYNFEKLLLADTTLKIRELFADKIKEIADYIVKCSREFDQVSAEVSVDLCSECDEYRLPSETEAQVFVAGLLGRPVPVVATQGFVNRPQS